MSWKRSNISMPTTQAGILGISSDTRIGGIELEPKTVMIAFFVFVVFIKLITVFIKV